MPRVSLDQIAPEFTLAHFTLADFTGSPVSLSHCCGRKSILLVCDRTFR